MSPRSFKFHCFQLQGSSNVTKIINKLDRQFITGYLLFSSAGQKKKPNNEKSPLALANIHEKYN